MGRQLNDQRIEEIVSRAQKLRPQMLPLWGRFSVKGMLYHCNTINNQILSVKSAVRPATLKEKLIRPVLYIMPKLPKGIATSNTFVSNDADSLIFENELTLYISLLNRFKIHQDPITGLHPIFGPLNSNEWKRFVWLHMDHHLRQFNV